MLKIKFSSFTIESRLIGYTYPQLWDGSDLDKKRPTIEISFHDSQGLLTSILFYSINVNFENVEANHVDAVAGILQEFIFNDYQDETDFCYEYGYNQNPERLKQGQAIYSFIQYKSERLKRLPDPKNFLHIHDDTIEGITEAIKNHNGNDAMITFDSILSKKHLRLAKGLKE